MSDQAAVRVGSTIATPIKIRDVKPVYPADALAAGVQGVVIIEATVDASGAVSSAHVIRGQPMLDQAALDAVRQWRYRPTMLNGSSVPVIMTMAVNFSMDNGTGADRESALAPPPPPPPPPPASPGRRAGTGPSRRKHQGSHQDQGCQANLPRGCPGGWRSGRGDPRSDDRSIGNVGPRGYCTVSPCWNKPPSTRSTVAVHADQLNGVPVPVIMTVTVNFTMDK